METALQLPEAEPLAHTDTGEQFVQMSHQAHALVRQAVRDGNWQPYIEHSRAFGRLLVQRGVEFACWYAALRVFQRRLIPALVDAYSESPARLKAALEAMTDFVDFSTGLVTEQYTHDKDHDLSELKKIEATLELRTHQLEDSNRDLEAFSYSVAHDLRAPLRAMHGFAQILLEDFASPLAPDAVTYLKKIQSNAKRMGTLIDALLGLSRLARGALQLQPVDLTALAVAVAAQLSVAEPSRSVEVTVEPGLTATGDARLVRIVLDNLIGNAWKFTVKSPSPRIAIGSTDGRTFYVRDNGAGFDMGHAGKLFSPFERMHNATEFPGTGIGLATVQRIVHRHRGRIWVKSQPGVGTTFFFTLAP